MSGSVDGGQYLRAGSFSAPIYRLAHLPSNLCIEFNQSHDSEFKINHKVAHSDGSGGVGVEYWGKSRNSGAEVMEPTTRQDINERDREVVNPHDNRNTSTHT